jgi:hypothetical protein
VFSILEHSCCNNLNGELLVLKTLKGLGKLVGFSGWSRRDS